MRLYLSSRVIVDKNLGLPDCPFVKMDVTPGPEVSKIKVDV